MLCLSKLIVWGSSWGRGFRFHSAKVLVKNNKQQTHTHEITRHKPKHVERQIRRVDQTRRSSSTRSRSRRRCWPPTVTPGSLASQDFLAPVFRREYTNIIVMFVKSLSYGSIHYSTYPYFERLFCFCAAFFW